MNDATLKQGNQILNLILQKKATSHSLQQLLASGVLSDILEMDTSHINRRELQRFLCIPPVAQAYLVPAVPASSVAAFVKKHGKYRDGALSIPKNISIIPEERIYTVMERITLLSLTCEDFLLPDDEDIDRNITEVEAIQEMERRGYTPCGICEMVDLLTCAPELKNDRYLSLVGFHTLSIAGSDTLCSVVWQAGHLAIRSTLDANCGSNCRFLAIRNY